MSVITDPWGITKDNYSTEVDSPEYERASSADSIVPSATELEKSRVDVKVQLLAEPAGQYMKHRLYEVIDMVNNTTGDSAFVFMMSLETRSICTSALFRLCLA